MTEITPAFVKGLFAQLVKVVGGVDPAAAYLGVSAERISQLQRLTCADLPTFLQVAALEQAAGRSIVFGGLAQIAEPSRASSDLAQEAAEVVEAAVELHKVARKGGSQRDLLAAAAHLQQEVADLPPLLAANQS